ncbi:MAG TPA: hypothetical protein VFE20_01255 [Thermoleophilia bacterium]|nr:hypothetical protein [Thermoleophilia bacterium]
MLESEDRRDEVDRRVGEMEYAVDHLRGPDDRRAFYLAREIDQLLTESRLTAEAWKELTRRLEGVKRKLERSSGG